jgi:hypothetical protein
LHEIASEKMKTSTARSNPELLHNLGAAAFYLSCSVTVGAHGRKNTQLKNGAVPSPTVGEPTARKIAKKDV